MTENKTPKVSVIMAAYNTEPYVAEAVDSILVQTFDNFEFIVIDDGSTDGTRDILASYDDPRLVLVRNKENIGLTRSLNKGLALARGEYIARQDADDISLPTRLEQQARFLDDHPEVGLVGTSWITMDEAGHPLAVTRAPTDSSYIGESLLTSLVVTHATVMFQRNCISKAGIYREIAGSAEDVDLLLRIAEHIQISNLPEPLYKVRVHAKSVVRSGLRRHLESRYRVCQMALERWQRTGKALSSPATIARCYLFLACQDFASGRKVQGRLHLRRALAMDPLLSQMRRRNAADIANCALHLCEMSGTSVSDWPKVGQRFINEVLSNLPTGWFLPARNVFAQFLATLSFDAYARSHFLEVIRHGLLGMLSDTHWCRNRGLWRIMGYSLLRRRIVL